MESHKGLSLDHYFFLYINDISVTSDLFSFILYADDTNILYFW